MISSPGCTLTAVILCTCLSAANCLGQKPAEKLRYEIVSVRASDPKAVDHPLLKENEDGLVEKNNTLFWLIRYAYDKSIPDTVRGGPSWIDEDSFDVEVKVAPDDVKAYKTLTPQEKESMLQPVLEERFNLRYRTEEKSFPVYFLTIAKGGLKMTESKPDASGKFDTLMHTTRKPEFIGKGLTIRGMDMNLSYFARRYIVDKTGLIGHYDFDLTWSDPPPPPIGGNLSANVDGTDMSQGPSFFKAVEEQLGLKLVPGSAPFPVMVIESVDRVPTPN